MSTGPHILERIDDLRKDQRAGPFWHLCGPWVECAEDIIAVGKKPKCQHEYTLETGEALRLWKLWQSFKLRPYREEPGKEIMVDAKNWDPVDGIHRAAVLYVLEKRVPAVLIDRPKPSKNRWVFHEMWVPEGE
jgi:hypothetical protein